MAKKTKKKKKDRPKSRKQPKRKTSEEMMLDLCEGISDRIQSGDTKGVVVFEFDENTEMRFGWSGFTPRRAVVDAVELVKMFFMIDDVARMKQQIAENSQSQNEE